MVWKDELLPGASRIPLPYTGAVPTGMVLDAYGAPTVRNDWVRGPQGVPVISGSSEAQPGYTGPVPTGGSALYAALASQAGQAEAARAIAAAGLSSLQANTQGPTIGGHSIDSPQAIPFLAALGQVPKQETELERLAREARQQQLGVS